MIDRRHFLTVTAACGLATAMSRSANAEQGRHSDASPATPAALKRLTPPAGKIPVAFVISDGAVMIDFVGPWEVFQDVYIPGQSDGPFELFTVGESTEPIRASG